MKVLVTGSEGYIGVPLCQHLMERGHTVTGLDTGYFRNGWLFNGVKTIPAVITKDIRILTAHDFEDYEAVVHMAELSNDPLALLDRENTFRVNHVGSVGVAKAAKEAGISRFVYTSSCSVYGIASQDFVLESSQTQPQTAYAECKLLVEQEVKELADDHFCPVFLRNATVYGKSPRMRFDLVLNNLAGLAKTTGEIKMTSDGTPWRPLVHIQDVAQAIGCALEAPRDAVFTQVFNVGNNDSNYQVKDIAEVVASVFTGCKLSLGDNGGDTRSYRVNFDKITHQLPGFKCYYDAYKGAVELYELFNKIDLTTEMFESKAYTRLKQLEYLIKTKQLDGELFWR